MTSVFAHHEVHVYSSRATLVLMMTGKRAHHEVAAEGRRAVAAHLAVLERTRNPYPPPVLLRVCMEGVA